MQIDQQTEISSDEWDAAVHASDDTWLFHTARWIELTASVWPLETRYFIARQNGRIVGGFPLQVAPGGRRPWIRPRAYSIRMGPTGPFVIRGVAAKTRRHALAALNEAVFEWARQRRLGAVECVLPPLAPNNRRNVRGVNPLVLLGWEDVSTHTWIVDLTKSESELQSALRRLARRMTRRASDQGFTVTRENWAELLDDYYRVHVETYRRTGVSPHPKAYFEGIARQFAPAGHAVLWVCRDAAGQPVAFHNCGQFADGACSWTGCSQSGYGESGVNYLLFWRSILGAKEDGCLFYEVGEAFPNASDEKLKGLTEFKSRFGGELYRFYRGQFHPSYRRSWFRPWWR